jgi:hypothetical protein
LSKLIAQIGILIIILGFSHSIENRPKGSGEVRKITGINENRKDQNLDGIFFCRFELSIGILGSDFY